MGNTKSSRSSKSRKIRSQYEVKSDHGNRYSNCETICPPRKIEKSLDTILKEASTGASSDKRSKREFEYNYKMNHKNRGLALIFNHEEYDNNYIDTRKGTHVDRDRLQLTFQSLGFDVRVYEDLEMDDVLYTLSKVAEMDHSDNDCLVVVFLTHGKLKDFEDPNSCNTLLNHDLMSYVYAKNSKYPLQFAWDYFTDEECPSLANKPRIFLVQACQGEEREKAIKLVPTNEKVKIETMSLLQSVEMPLKIERTANLSLLPKQDFLVAYSSLPGFGSFRHPLEGSWFIQSFCDEMSKREPADDFLATLTRVTQKVAFDYETRSSNPKLHERKQTPFIVSRLTKLLVFTKKYE